MSNKPRGVRVGELRADDFFSLSRLQGTWSALRKEITKAPFRDCIDYLELDVTSADWLGRISRRLVDGTYRPQEPGRRETAKSAGAFRVITAPTIEDVVVYRHIADHVYELARPNEPRGAYFSRRHRVEPVGQKVDEISDEDYATFFRIWLRYNDYRGRRRRDDPDLSIGPIARYACSSGTERARWQGSDAPRTSCWS